METIIKQPEETFSITFMCSSGNIAMDIAASKIYQEIFDKSGDNHKSPLHIEKQTEKLVKTII